MRKIVLVCGLVSGGILAAMTAIMLSLCMSGRMGFDQSEVVGYTAMILSFLLVFIGIRSYRERVGGGTITFGKAFQVGILITLVACAVYVVAWEIVYFNFVPDFAEKFAAFTVDKMRAKGATAAAIAATTQQMAEFQRLYANPLFNVAITFLEVFPVGVIVTLVSAAILRKRAAGQTPGVAGAAGGAF